MQSGFGWTNGVVLYFLWLYPDLTVTDESGLPINATDPTDANTTTTRPPSIKRRSLGWVAAPVLLLLAAAVLVLCGVWCRWLYRSGEQRYWRRVHNEHLRAAAGGTTDTSEQRQVRDSSEETDESADNDKKGLFS